MQNRIEILPGVWLRAIQSEKFKTGCFSIYFLRPHCREEAACNALLANVLLRGDRVHPDMRSICAFLENLYGATVAGVVRKMGDVQTPGLSCDFIEDCFTQENEPVFQTMARFAAELLLEPLVENDGFCASIVEVEKQNLINAIEAKKNDKRGYINQLLLKKMFAGEPYGVPRLGEIEDVAAITPQSLYAHYRRILAQSQVEIFYMGRKQPEQAAGIFREALQALPRTAPFAPILPPRPSRPTGKVWQDDCYMNVTQAKLAIGLRTGCTGQQEEYPALLLLNVVLGSGVTSKLFVNVREKRSLCYYADSALDKFKGIMLICSGVDEERLEETCQAILNELEQCRQGNISEAEMETARRSLLSGLRASLDSPGYLDTYELGRALCPDMPDIPTLSDKIRTLSIPQLVEAAKRITLDGMIYLKKEKDQ